jgi:hypothetical protein
VAKRKTFAIGNIGTFFIGLGWLSSYVCTPEENRMRVNPLPALELDASWDYAFTLGGFNWLSGISWCTHNKNLTHPIEILRTSSPLLGRPKLSKQLFQAALLAAQVGKLH